MMATRSAQDEGPLLPERLFVAGDGVPRSAPPDTAPPAVVPPRGTAFHAERTRIRGARAECTKPPASAFHNRAHRRFVGSSMRCRLCPAAARHPTVLGGPDLRSEARPARQPHAAGPLQRASRPCSRARPRQRGRSGSVWRLGRSGDRDRRGHCVLDPAAGGGHRKGRVVSLRAPQVTVRVETPEPPTIEDGENEPETL